MPKPWSEGDDRRDAPVRFAAASGIRVLVFEDEDEAVVFSPESWEAHLLNAAAAAVLELLAQSAQTVADIERQLRAMLVDEEQARASEHAQRLLGEFEQLGLVRRLEEDADAGG